MNAGFTIKTAQRAFFTSSHVQRAVDAGKRRALSRFGAFVRADSRQSIRKQPFVKRKKRGQERTSFARKPAPKGKPPGNVNGLLRNNLFFVYNPSRGGVVIGPAYLPGMRRDNLRMLEFGGTRVVRGRRQNYGIGNPFMRPAFNKNLPKAAALFKDQVR